MPFGDIVDGVFLSDLDAAALGAKGIARSSQNSINKLLNSALSKSTISMIASANGSNNRKQGSLSLAVSSSLCLALVIGYLQFCLFAFGAQQVLAISGIGQSSNMFAPALGFLKIQSLAAPAATMWLVATNIFRGLGDASIPLKCALLFNVLNFLFDYIFIKLMQLGVIGSSIASVVGQSLALVPLLLSLKKWAPLRMVESGLSTLNSCISQYARAGILLIGRSIARIAAFSYCSRQSALLGPVAASSYSILYQLGFWVTMLCESISIATQSLLARFSSDKSVDGKSLSSFIIRRAFLLGGVLSISLSLLIFLFRHPLIASFAKNQEIQTAAIESIPFFLLTQLVKGFAFPMNGIVLGNKDWAVSFWSMCFANVICFSCLRFFKRQSIHGLWIAWTAYYLAQGLAGLVWYKQRINSS